jgi:hypothetical protein
VAKTDFEKMSDQLRSQLEDLKSGIDDVLKNWNRFQAKGMEWMGQSENPMAKAARQARMSVEDVGEGWSAQGFPWWTPLAVVGVVGAGIWLYNMLTARGTQTGMPPLTNYPAGSPPPRTTTETPFSEQR